LLLILPLSLMLVAALCGAALEVKSPGWKGLIERLRLAVPQRTLWLWAIALSGFMFGGTVADLVAVVAAGLALWLERTGRIAGFAGVLAAVLVKRIAYLLQPTFAAVRFFNPALFNDAFFEHFGPHDFMGIPLHAAWWIPVYYAATMFVCNIGAEELWWRGYVLPRQELAFGRATWIVHGILWSAFHLFMQPTLWDTLRMSITGLALSFVAQRTKSTWPGIIGHSFGNLAFFLSLVNGVRS
jgi:membrane protease YdiL (CAAX protease family)